MHAINRNSVGTCQNMVINWPSLDTVDWLRPWLEDKPRLYCTLHSGLANITTVLKYYWNINYFYWFIFQNFVISYYNLEIHSFSVGYCTTVWYVINSGLKGIHKLFYILKYYEISI